MILILRSANHWKKSLNCRAKELGHTQARQPEAETGNEGVESARNAVGVIRTRWNGMKRWSGAVTLTLVYTRRFPSATTIAPFPSFPCTFLSSRLSARPDLLSYIQNYGFGTPPNPLLVGSQWNLLLAIPLTLWLRWHS